MSTSTDADIWWSWTPWLAGIQIILNATFSVQRTLVLPTVYVLVFLLANIWQNQDEVFHIPQAQAYCEYEFEGWDPKLTTPPGLYGFAVLFSKALAGGICDPHVLRLFNVTVLVLTMAFVYDCRATVTRIWKRDPSLGTKGDGNFTRPFSPDALHTAANLALFPPLFFFSGLFYTDVISTCVVVLMYKLFLQRSGAYNHSTQGLGWILATGILALTMRQTNIFWASIFLGGLEVVRTVKKADFATPPATKPLTEIVSSSLEQFKTGRIHDVSLEDAGIDDFVLCAISITVAALYQIKSTLIILWPYIGILTTFGWFVLWNGGVVLGDKSNHVATIHLSQMLYIWPFISFFSAPLQLTTLLSIVRSAATLAGIPNPTPKSGTSTPILRRLFLGVTFTAAALGVVLAIIHFNTIIHPFTLADNRHYVFYVFRYTILRNSYIRYALAPIYLFCAYLAFDVLGISKALPLEIPDMSVASNQYVRSRPSKKEDTTVKLTIKTPAQITGPTTSFALIWLLTTSLSLITAPLVEPRYFILPWVMWRLNVPTYSAPSRRPNSFAEQARRQTRTHGALIAEFLAEWLFRAHDYRLWLETAWFLLVNVGTAYVFLYRGFAWPQEPGLVQRFMW